MAGMIARPTPIPRSSIATPITANGVVSVTSTNGIVAAARIRPPSSEVRPAPSREVKRPERNMPRPPPMPWGISRMPVMIASSPRIVWKYSGIRIIAPNSAAPRQKVTIEAARKAGLANSLRSSSGCSIRCDRTTNAASRASPASAGPSTDQEVRVPAVALSDRP